MTTEKRNLIKLIMIGIVILMMFSCTSSHLHYSGNYRIDSLEGDTVTFKGVRGRYSIPNEGLKNGQRIYLKRTYQREKVNVYPVK